MVKGSATKQSLSLSGKRVARVMTKVKPTGGGSRKSQDSWGGGASLESLSTEGFRFKRTNINPVASDDNDASESSDDDSAVLFAEDNEEELISAQKATKSNHTTSQLAEQHATQSSRLIYGIVLFLVAAAILVASLVHHVANKHDKEEYEAAVSSFMYANLVTAA